MDGHWALDSNRDESYGERVSDGESIIPMSRIQKASATMQEDCNRCTNVK